MNIFKIKFVKSIFAGTISFGLLFFNTAPFVMASDISGVTPTQQGGHNVYDIEASKVSGSTGFRHYNNFNLSQGDVANLIYRLGYDKFVNLVNSQVNINGILNTMRDNNFFNGRAIFVSPGGVVIGASGVLNVGSLTLMAPSQNAYNAFKKLYDNNSQLSKIEYDINNDNYKSLITNSSGTITINGKIFAKDGVEAYARQINIKKDSSNEGNSPAIFAGVQNQTVMSDYSDATSLFNSLVSSDFTSANGFELQNGKIALVTNKANEENITTQTEDNKTVTVNVNTGLKTTTTGSGDSATKAYAIDKTYSSSSLSSDDSVINIEDANIISNEIDIQANATSTKEVTKSSIENYGKAVKESENTGNNTNNNKKDETTGYKISDSFKNVAPEAVAKVTISNSKVSGEKVSVKANATNKTENYIQLIDPVWEKWLSSLGSDVLNTILSTMGMDTDNETSASAGDMISQYFSDDAYTYLDGAKATSIVTIKDDSKILAKDSVIIEAVADATTKITTGELDSHPLFMYGLGVKANSDVKITDSNIKTSNDGKVNVNAYSKTSDNIKYDSSKFLAISNTPTNNSSSESSNNSSQDNTNNNSNNNNNNTSENNNNSNNNQSSQQNTVSAYNLTLLNNSIISAANVEINGSTIDTKDLSLNSIGFNKGETYLTNVSHIGENADKTGIAATFLINHVDTKSNVEIKNNSKITTGNDVNLLSQNINYIDNYIETEVKAKNQTYPVKTKTGTTFNPTYSIKAYELLNKKILNKATDKIGNVLDKANLEISGSAIWNDEQNTSNAIVNDSTINAKNISIISNMVDLVANGAEAYATAGNKFSAGMAIVVNDQNNTNNAKIINGSKINAESGLNVNATTQLPMNPMELKIGKSTTANPYELNLYIGASFDQSEDSITDWDADFIHTQLKNLLNKDTATKIKNGIGNNPVKYIRDSKVVLDGLFSNYAKAEGTGETLGVAGSVVANSILNNTNAFIDGSQVNITNGDVSINASNSVVNYNGAGKVDFILEEINDFINGANDDVKSKFGVGGSVLVNTFTNNANAYINNSKIIADKGDINVNSASEEAYVNLTVTGGKSQTFAVDGSVNVQNINGKTLAYIEKAEEVKANNVSVNAGKAKIKPKKSSSDDDGDPVELNKDTKQLSVGDEREIKDSVLNISILGVNSKTEGSGASVGASVNAANSNRETKAYINDSKITTEKDVSVTAANNAKNIGVVLAGAFAGGVSTDKQTQQNANENNTSENNSTSNNNSNNESSSSENSPQKMENAGNWMDILDNASDDDNDVLGLQNLFDENNANKEGAQKAQDQVGNNTTKLADGTADPQSATKNFSLALAGAVSVVNDNSSVTSEIIKSTINVGDKLKVTSDRDNLIVNIAGGLAKSGNVGGGAAVNVYSDKGKAVSKISEAIITFTSNNAKNLEVVSSNNHDLINGAIGIGVASNNQQGVKAAVGGSFNTNILKDSTESIIDKTTIQNTENIANDIDINVNSNSNTNVWNVGGDLGFANASNGSFALGAGVAGNYNLLKQSVEAEIIGSTLTNAKNINTKAELTQKLNSISVAGAIVSGAKSSFTIDGALGIDLIANEVLASLSGSTVSSTGDIDVAAISNITGQNLTGGLEFSSSNNSAGVGIGSVTEVDNSNITAKINNSTIEKSNSIDVNANSKDDRKFLAANLGAQTGSGTTIEINANGIISVLKSTVDALVMGGSTLSSDGDINVLSNYTNINQGITTVADVAKDGLALGANVILNHYGNEITSNIANDSNILKSGNIGVGAKSSEYINVIPVAISFATGGAGAVAADVVVNVIEDKTNAIAAGILNTDGNLTVAADGETTIYNRGGTLAVSSANALAAFGGAINVDYIGKTVNAKIGGDSYTYTDETGNEHTVKNKVKAEGNVSATAVSTNSIGGTPTKDNDNNYNRDDITSSTYQDNLMKKNSNGEYTGINYNNDFSNWNMFYNLSAGANAAISGTVIVKTIENEVTAEISNADITSSALNIKAEDYSIKNIIAGQIGASSTAAVGVQVLVTKDNSDTSALISNDSDITVKNALNINAENIKDNNQIVAAGNFASNVAVGANVLHNTISDNTIAKIDSSKVKSNKLEIAANEDINASRIVVAASGSGQGVAINVSPLINYYGYTTGNSNEADKRGKTIAEISNSLINDALITLQSDTNIKTRDIAIGVAGAGQGFAASGLAIRNNYDTITKAIINLGSTINTSKDVNLNANSATNANNWIVGVSGVGEGFSAIANVIINDLASTVETNISDSTIVNAGNISLNTNKGKKDKLNNYAISGNVAGIGAAASANVIYNIYENDIVSKIYNTAIEISNLITTQAFSDRALKNINIGLSVAGIGADLLANAIVNEIGTDTLSFVDAQSNRINTNGKLTVKAEDKTFAENKIGFGVGAGLGAALGTNINLYYSDNLARAEVLSNSDGQINAGSTDISSNIVSGLDNENVGVAVGLVGLAGDVLAVKLGKHVDYTDSEKTSGIEDANKKVNDIYEDTTKTERNFREENSSKLETGAISRIKGNLKAKNNIDIKAESKLKGKGNDDKLSLTNVQTTVGLGEGSVAVRDIQLANNTIAEISGGKVESTNGNISLNAKNTANVNIKNVEVHVSGLNFSGGSTVYNNNSETIAQIGSLNDETTVNSKNGINVISNSTSKSDIDATNVVVTGGEIVAVDLSESKDNNNSSAQIIGKTNIDTAGKLMVHSTANTDLSSTKSTVSVTGANMVSVSKNEVEASAISKAIIKDVEGTIKANGIDIVTDYDTMKAFSKANVTAVKLSDEYSGDSSGAKMNAKFTSGIDSVSDLIINNSGKTSITTAKKNGSSGIEAVSEINNVHVSLEGFVAETTAKAENTAETNTILKAKDHKASSLDINSYLDTKADASAGSVKATVGIGVNLASTNAKDTSNLNVDIAGKNTITGNAGIKASHNAEVKSDMSSFNFGGLVGGGQKVRIDSDNTANTTGNIGGDFNVNTANIAFNTTRNAIMTKSSGSGGGIVNVSDTKASNKLNGNSVLNIKNYNSDKSIANNNLTISNVSNNTFDTTSHDGSGGFINVSQNDTTAEMKATTVTNIIDSVINSNNKVAYDVQNNTTVKDEASMGGGGFVAVMDNTTTATYTSGAKLSVQNSTINAEDIELKSLSSIKSANNDWIDYVGKGGGFVATNALNLTNTLNQTSEIEIKNSKLHADNEAKLEAKTSSAFRQKTDSAVSGFTAMPRSKNWLNVTNNNKITVDNSSTVAGDNKLTINFDSNNELKARAVAESNHFGFRDPWAESYIDLRINNTLQNDGSLQGGNLVDVNFMNNSTNNLTQYAYSEANAAIATTSEDGKITKKVINALNISSNADITSNKDVEISYSAGKGSNDSTIKWKTTSYGLFGIPIRHSKTYSKTDISTNNTLNIDGKIVAGQGNSKYMKINKDGSVDTTATKGFSAGDYTLTGGEALDGQQIKDKKLANIQIKIDNAESELSEINTEIDNLNTAKSSYETEKTNAQASIDELNNLANSYTFKNNVIDSDGNSEFNTLIQNDLKSQIVGEVDDEGKLKDANKLTEAEYTTLLSKYQEKLNDSDSNITISEFLSTYIFDAEDAAKDSAKKTTVTTTYSTIYGNVGTTNAENGYTTYTALNGNKYLSVKNPTTVDGKQTCDEITELKNYITSLDKQMQPYKDKITADTAIKTSLKSEITAWTNEKTTISNTPASEFGVSSEKYAVVFNDMQAKDAHILIDGITNNSSQFKGSGTLSVATQGLQVDNYSTRSLIFNDIDLNGTSQSGLIIGGKNFSEFAGDGTNQAVNGAGAYIYKFTGLGKFDTVGKEGAHYISSSASSNEISGIIVNNFYDIFNPFAKSQAIINPALASDITFNGLVKTGSDFNVFNDSGSIIAGKLNSNNISGAINLVSTKGDVNLTSANDFALKTNDSIFAGNSVNIKANKVNNNGTIKAGYNSDLKLTITDSMLSNLTYDPTTGENNLINLGNTPYSNTDNNIKAIYKDGQIYLFNINNEVNGVNQADRGKIAITSNSDTNTINGTVKMYDGYQTITVNNQTNKPLVVSNITNQKSAGGFYINGTKSTDKTPTTIDKAETAITSTGKLTLDGIIKNNVIAGAADTETAGKLQLNANNGLEIKKQTNEDNSVINSIYNGGITEIKITNGGSVIAGYIDNYGRNIEITNNGTGKLDITGDITNAANDATYKIAINSNGQTAVSSAVTSKVNGGINIDSKGLELKDTSKIDAKNNDIAITNKTGDNNALVMAGEVKAQNGSINITNNGKSANIGGTISDEKGDITITNTKGDMTISSTITHDLINQTANGMITISNSGSGKLDIQSDIKTYGAGKADTEDNNIVKAIRIVNSNADSEKLSLSNAISSRVGDIYIKSNSKKFNSTADISNIENGNIFIETLNGNAILGGKITAKEGNIDIFASENAYSLNILESLITNQKGDINITTQALYNLLITKSVIDNIKANTTIVNTSNNFIIDEGTVIKNIESGNIAIENKGRFSINDASLRHLGTGNITIKNYYNYEAADESSIVVNNGNIDIENHIDTLLANGTIQNANGNITITNFGTTTNIGGSISNENGDITITNTKGDMTISSLINHNINNQNAKGMISITNGANAGKLDIQSSIQTKGAGKIQTIDEIERNVAILIDNQSTTNGLTIDNALISARIGDIIIKNNKNDLNITSGTISNTENGNISITNADTANVLRVAADVKALNEGNINIINNGSDDTTISGAITANTGNINIENINGGNTSLLGAVATTKGNIDITNNNSGKSSVLTLKGNINNNVQGNIIISQENSGKMNILSDINANDGIISILNINSGDIKIDTHAGITSEKGEIQIYNEGSSDIYQYGQVVAFNGNVGIGNTKGAIYSQGAVVAQEANVVIANTIGDLVLNSLYGANNGNVQIFNYNGNLYFDENAMILNTKSSSDDTNYGISIVNINNDNVLGMYLNGHILNYGGGDIDISNYGNDGAVIGGYIFNEIGNINISNATKALELTGVVTTSKGGNISIVNTGDDGIRLSDGNRISSDGGFVSITNYSNDFVMEEGAKIDVFYQNNNNITDIYLKNESTAGKMTISGKIENEGIKGLNIINNSTSGIEFGETAKILNKQTNTVISNTAGELNIKNGAEILNTQSEDIKVENTGNKLTIAGLLKNLGEGNIELSNTGSDGINIEGTVNTAKQNIIVTNKDSDINIGKFGTTNDTYIKADIGNVVINQTNGNLVNSVIDSVGSSNRQNFDLGNPNPAYKTLISTGNDLVINIVDGNIGSAVAKAATSTNASTRDYTDSINVSVAGNITATAKNTNSTDKRLVNIRSKEADMNIEKIDVDGDVVLTSVDWKYADNINGSSDSEYYKGYSVNNAANSGDYAIKAQNVSIISSNDIGSENNKLTILQDKLENVNSTLNTFAENSIYYDISSNDTNNNLSIGTLRTKSQYGTIGLDLSSNANIDTIVPGGSVDITQKAQDLSINTISMYGNNNISEYNTSEDILYPHDRLGYNAGAGKLVLKALDAYANDKPHSNLVVNNAYIYGRGLNDSDVELYADNVVFNAISKSNISNKPVVFDIQGVSKDEVNAVNNSTRNDYKYAGGHYIVNNADLNIKTNSANNHGAVINTIYANDATVKTNNTNLTVKDGFIDDYGTFINGTINAAGYNHVATVNNRSKGLIPTHVQMYTKKTGDFNLGMNGSIVINTNAPVVHYIDEVLVNGYNSENSFTRLTLKENIVQQVGKDLHKGIYMPEGAMIKTENIKMDTSNIITNEIINYTSSSNEIKDEDENKNISLEKEEKVGG